MDVKLLLCAKAQLLQNDGSSESKSRADYLMSMIEEGVLDSLIALLNKIGNRDDDCEIILSQEEVVEHSGALDIVAGACDAFDYTPAQNAECAKLNDLLRGARMTMRKVMGVSDGTED